MAEPYEPGEGALSNWLSEIIERERSRFDRVIPFLGQWQQRKAIVAAIKVHPEGAPLVARGGLRRAVGLALRLANMSEQDQQRDSQAEISSAFLASELVFFELDLPSPEPGP